MGREPAQRACAQGLQSHPAPRPRRGSARGHQDGGLRRAAQAHHGQPVSRGVGLRHRRRPRHRGGHRPRPLAPPRASGGAHARDAASHSSPRLPAHDGPLVRHRRGVQGRLHHLCRLLSHLHHHHRGHQVRGPRPHSRRVQPGSERAADFLARGPARGHSEHHHGHAPRLRVVLLRDRGRRVHRRRLGPGLSHQRRADLLPRLQHAPGGGGDRDHRRARQCPPAQAGRPPPALAQGIAGPGVIPHRP